MPEQLQQKTSEDSNNAITLGGKKAFIGIVAVMAGAVVMLLIIRAFLM